MSATILLLALLSAEPAAAHPGCDRGRMARRSFGESAALASLLPGGDGPVPGGDCAPPAARSADVAALHTGPDLREPFSSDFCRNPYGAICGVPQPGTVPPAHVKRETAFRTRALAIAGKAVAAARVEARRLGVWPGTDAEFTLEAYLALIPTLRVDQIATIAGAFDRARDAALIDLDTATAGALTQVKTLMGSAITRQRSSLPGNAATRAIYAAGMQASVNNIELVTPRSAAAFFGSDAAGLADYQQGYTDICGADGLHDNAFAYAWGAREIVVVCPGKMLRASVDSEFGFVSFEHNLMRTLGHEIGHRFDATVPLYSGAYSRFASCAEEQAEYVPEATEPRMREISADIWGTQVLEEHFRAMAAAGQPITDTQALAFLRESLQNFCDGDDAPGEFHPTGRYRIEALLRFTPEIHTRFECEWDSTTAPVACTLEGATFLPDGPDSR
ncbi:MAG: hypothetical protein IT285_05555 [Bdellovibrionales bacterium]|nr:hypothetical protein [Bdellovibrionales bacterium]